MSKVILFLLCGVVSAGAGLSKLEAIAMIESGNNDAAIGSAGEVSRYQIKPRIWREYSPSRAWRDKSVSTQVAQEYLADLEATFRRQAGREATDFDLYVLWNAGPAYYARVGYAARRVNPIVRERAQRYANLRTMRNELPVALASSKPAAVPPTAPPEVAVAATVRETINAPLPSLMAAPLVPTLTGIAPLAEQPRLIPGGRSQANLLVLGGMRAR